ncbi:aldo/keto reductase [Nisaea acidiphila]|uniref:Aldo/keto reductase n=1 Tax=Nisaea acidiphila TaxID=1862145 RepID=A0A9J7APX8_9PROT|nr:aldo/keto reductase [Nisaea acidiphila]UUX48962.1 aldo/keto reductase [Nisaea acidiphila]
MSNPGHIDRRRFLAGSAAALSFASLPLAAQSASPLMRTIPSSGEAVPAVGLGSWITFNVGNEPVMRASSAGVMDAFFDAGGRMIDSSPMYGSSQDVIGAGLEKIGRTGDVFSADKVWTGDTGEGPAQIEQSREYWRVPRFDLVQVHNLVGWEAHLDTLAAMKDDGRLRYIGITTSHGRRHDLFEKVMRSRTLDFIQVTYNPVDREVEDRILPLARERGIAVIVNRPFRRGDLTRRLEREPIPEWAAELGADTWAQIVLKYILSGPAETIPIPATTRPEHARENVGAASGPLLDAAMRDRISAFIRNL